MIHDVDGCLIFFQIYEIPDHSWVYIYKSPYQITKCTKFRWFQTSINHRILPTNHLLNKMNISDDPKCTFCGEENKTISHLLWNCSHTKAFITELTNQFQYKSLSNEGYDESVQTHRLAFAFYVLNSKV